MYLSEIKAFVYFKILIYRENQSMVKNLMMRISIENLLSQVY